MDTTRPGGWFTEAWRQGWEGLWGLGKPCRGLGQRPGLESALSPRSQDVTDPWLPSQPGTSTAFQGLRGVTRTCGTALQMTAVMLFEDEVVKEEAGHK